MAKTVSESSDLFGTITAYYSLGFNRQQQREINVNAILKSTCKKDLYLT